jgi:dihydroorotate dehydrogenase
MYRLVRNLLFLLDAETAHYFSMNLLGYCCRIGLLRSLLRNQFQPRHRPAVRVFGLEFRNPVGLAAGFDKNALYLDELDILGFGFVEVGTVTPLPQMGNPKPRLFRLQRDKALVNRMGFNNDGMDAVAERLKKWRKKHSERNNHTQTPMIIGGNIGKNKSTDNEEAWQDYNRCFVALHPYVDYFAVNVSSPNTPGLRALQEKDSLRRILTGLQELNLKQAAPPRPILLKIAPDLDDDTLNDITELCLEIGLNGLIATNTTIGRENLRSSKEEIEKAGAGGLSGKPLAEKSTELVRLIHEKSGDRLPVIASGGIFTATDILNKAAAGARLFQVWTGFVYEGPMIVKHLLKNYESTSSIPVK